MMSQPSPTTSRGLDLVCLLLPRAGAPVSLRVQIALERAIALGLFPEGRLPSERQLAATLDVSRTALRSALDLVRDSGYAERSLVGRTGGVPTSTVRSMSGEEIRDNASQALTEIAELMAVRKFLEPAFARAAATSFDAEQIDELVETQESLVREPTQMSHRLTDCTFHHHLASVSGSDAVIGLMLRSRADLSRWRDRLPMEDTVGHSVTEHWSIIDAITDGDGDRAEAAMLAHLESAESLFELFLRRYLDAPEVILAEGEAALARGEQPELRSMRTDRLRRSHP